MRIWITIFCFIVVSVSLSAEPEWNKEFSKEGIDVYTRAIEGTSIKEFKGTGVIDGSIEDVNAVLDNIPALTTWMPDCLVSKVVEKKDLIILLFIRSLKPHGLLNTGTSLLKQ